MNHARYDFLARPAGSQNQNGCVAGGGLARQLHYFHPGLALADGGRNLRSNFPTQRIEAEFQLAALGRTLNQRFDFFPVFDRLADIVEGTELEAFDGAAYFGGTREHDDFDRAADTGEFLQHLDSVHPGRHSQIEQHDVETFATEDSERLL